jgi:hypothetical protein
VYLDETGYNVLIIFIKEQGFPNDHCLRTFLTIAKNDLTNPQQTRGATFQANTLSQANDSSSVPSQSTLDKICGFATQ